MMKLLVTLAVVAVAIVLLTFVANNVDQYVIDYAMEHPDGT